MDSAEHNSQVLSGIANFTAAIANSRLYSDKHPQVKRYIENAYEALANALNHFSELTFILIGEEVIFNNTPLKIKAPYMSQFKRLLKENGIERLSFVSGLTQIEFHRFIHNLALPENKKIQSQTAIRLGKINLGATNGIASPSSSVQGSIPLDSPKQLEIIERLKKIPLENFQEIYTEIRMDKTANVKGLGGIISSFIDAFSHGLKPLQMLANLKSADQYTFTHVVNVCLLTMAQAEMLGISGDKLYDVGIAAALHDVGKLFVPDSILNKPSVLTQEERIIVENHALAGAQYILRLHDVPRIAILGALEHHIRYDGSGYPFIKNNWRPHLVSQMISISDIYDAMRSHRPYQNPKPEELILNILAKEKGTAFNPRLVDNFLNLVNQTPLFVRNQEANSPNQRHSGQTHIPRTSDF